MEKKQHSVKAVVLTWSLILLGVFALLWTNPFGPALVKVAPDVEVVLPETEPWQENMAKGQLQELYMNCKMFWDREGDDQPCSIEQVSHAPYHFSQTPKDRDEDEGFAPVTLTTGFKTGFSARANHENSSVVWTIDNAGEFNCSLGVESACEAITHLTREEILAEAREFAGDVPDDAQYIEIK